MQRTKAMFPVWALVAVLAVILTIIPFAHTARADAGEVLGTHNPLSGYSGPYRLDGSGEHAVWCADFGKAEPMAGGGGNYGEPQKLQDVSDEDLRVVLYALQEGKRAIEEGNAALSGAVASVIHASGLNKGIPFDPETMVPDESKADFHRIMNDAPEAPKNAWLTARIPEGWTPGGKDGYQRVLDYDQVKLGTLEVAKVDATTKSALAGAEFKVVNEQGETVVDSRKTKETPYRIQIDPGTYTVIEGTAPKGYGLNGDGSSKDNSVQVTIEPGAAKRVTFANKPLPEITIRKVDGSGAPLPGAVVKVSGDNGSEATFTTDGNPHVLKVWPGTYTVEELQAPDGYIKESKKLTVNAVVGDKPEVTIVNKAEPKPVPVPMAAPAPKQSTPTSTPRISKSPTPTPTSEPVKEAPTPRIGTQAHLVNDNMVTAGGKIVDQVSYAGLQPGKEYTLKAVAMCKDTGEPTPNTGEAVFTPEAEAGIQEVTIGIADERCPILTVFEELYLDGEVVAEHKDINDVAQTVGTRPQPKEERIVIKHIPSGGPRS